MTGLLMAEIFLAESGHTGTDLLNPDLPAFALASLDLTEGDCAKPKAEYFGDCEATDLESTKLVKGPRGAAHDREVTPSLRPTR
jgi:hypothetical protein